MNTNIMANDNAHSLWAALLGHSRLWLFLASMATAFIAYKSLVPTELSSDITHFDKILHFVAYFGLAGLFMAGLPRRSIIMIILSISVLGALIEILQTLMNLGRDGSIMDMMANSLGAICGAIIAHYILKSVGARSN